MIVYRIEDRDGIGPFRSHHSPIYELLESYSMPFFPTPREEIGVWMEDPLLVGCKSIDHLERWFGNPATWQLLKDSGFFMSAYRVDDAQQGKYQVIFSSDEATKLWSIKL